MSNCSVSSSIQFKDKVSNDEVVVIGSNVNGTAEENGTLKKVFVDKNLVFKNIEEQIPLIEKIHRKIENHEKFFSLEFFPPRTKLGADKWKERIDTMKLGRPLFCDVTWHPTETVATNGETSSIKTARIALENGLEVMLHITCINMTEQLLIHYLDTVYEIGIRSILVLRGDIPEDIPSKSTPPKSGEESPLSKSGLRVSSSLPEQRFKYAVDMVRFIRERYGTKFTIGVAGYPHGHPESESLETDLIYLRQKVDAGADFIVTQLFFDVTTFVSFVTSCRSIGITCPIIPGILPIRSYDSLRHIVKLSKLTVPKDIEAEIESRREKSENGLNVSSGRGTILDYGRELTIKLANDLLNCGYAPGIHFYTLNQDEPTVSALKAIGLWNENTSMV